MKLMVSPKHIFLSDSGVYIYLYSSHEPSPAQFEKKSSLGSFNQEDRYQRARLFRRAPRGMPSPQASFLEE